MLGVAVVVCAVVASCGGIETDDGHARLSVGRDGGHPRPEPGDGDGSMYLGRWLGTTSQGLSFTFNVEESDPAIGVTFIGYGWRLPTCAFEDHILFEDAAPIIAGALAVQIEAPGSVLDITVSFDDPEHAHGTLGFVASRLPDAPACTGGDAVSLSAWKQQGE
jgi:hypothetical protein